PTTPPMMPLPSAEEEALRRPRSMATGSWLEGAEEKPVRKVAHNRDRPEPSQLKGLRPFARAAGLLALCSPHGAERNAGSRISARLRGRPSGLQARGPPHGDHPPPAGRGQLEDERA